MTTGGSTRRPFCRLPMRIISQNFDEGSVPWYPVAISSDRFLVNLAENYKYCALYHSVTALLHVTCAMYYDKSLVSRSSQSCLQVLCTSTCLFLTFKSQVPVETFIKGIRITNGGQKSAGSVFFLVAQRHEWLSILFIDLKRCSRQSFSYVQIRESDTP